MYENNVNLISMCMWDMHACLFIVCPRAKVTISVTFWWVLTKIHIRIAIDVRENMQGLFNDLHLFLPGEFNMNEHKFLAEIVMFTSFLRSEIFITPRTIFNVIIWVLFICLQCKSPLTMYFGLRIETWSSSGGLSKQIIWTAFVLVHKRSSGTNVFIIIEIMIKKWLNQNLGQSKPIV